jgi:hypothetical protein
VATQVLTIANTTISGWSPQGQGSSAHSGDNAIDQNDATALVPTATGVWNAVYVLPSSFAADSYRVLSTGTLTWNLQTGQGTTGADSEFTTQAQGASGDTGIVSLPVPIGVREVRLNVTINNTNDRIYSFEFYAGGEPVPATNSDVDARLAAWLRDDTDNSHKDTSTIPGLPWTIKQAVDAIQAVTDRVDALSDAAITRLNDLSDAAIDALNAGSDGANSWMEDVHAVLTGASGGGGSAFYSADNRQVAQTVADLADAVAANVDIELLRERLTLSPDVSDTTRWTLVDTITGVGNDYVPIQADLYRLTFTTIPAVQPQHDVGGAANWLPRLGWWAPLRDGFVGPRGYLDFESNDLRWPPYLMHGMVVKTGPGVEWSVSCYVLDRA